MQIKITSWKKSQSKAWWICRLNKDKVGTWCKIIGLLANSTSGFGTLRVSGLSRVPNPPTRISAFILRYQSSCLSIIIKILEKKDGTFCSQSIWPKFYTTHQKRSKKFISYCSRDQWDRKIAYSPERCIGWSIYTTISALHFVFEEKKKASRIRSKGVRYRISKLPYNY